MTPQEQRLAAAHTLKEWYSALGEELPNPAIRAGLYYMHGLGGLTTYVGTAEQNNRLLVALKRARGAL